MARSDNGFGPQLGSRFDFTLRFEQSILGIAPNALFLVLAPCYIYSYMRRPACARNGIFLWAKLAVAICLVAFGAANIAVYAKSSIFTSTAAADATLSLIASLAIVALVAAEHRKALRPSSLFSVYLFLSLLFDVVKSRSFFLRHDDALGGLAAGAAGAKLALSVLQEVPKRSLILDEHLRKYAGNETFAGFWNRACFVWVSSMFRRGYSQTLRLHDLEPLGPSLASKPLFNRFTKIWSGRKNNTASGVLAMACFYTLWWPFLAVVIPRLLYSGFTFSQPFLMQQVVKCIEKEDAEEYERISLLVASGIVFVGRAITNVLYFHANYRCVTATRGVLVSAMADKQLRLKHDEAKKSAISTLMTADVEGLEMNLPELHELWGYFVDIGLGLYFLYKFIGVAMVVIFVPVIFSVVYGSLIGKLTGSGLKDWNASIESRVAQMTIILEQQLPIRMMGLGPAITKFAQNLRIIEMGFSKKFRKYTISTMTGALCIEAFTPVIVIAAALFWTKFKDGFTPEVAFPTMSLIMIVSMPLFYLVDTCASLPRLWACFNRIQAYLQLPEWQDERKAAVSAEEAVEKPDDSEETEKPSCVIEYHDAWINPPGNDTTILQNVTMRILRGKILALLGPIACGKSTFLNSLIGEGTLLHGSLVIAALKWAFCDQSPWLPNMSIRDVIVGQNPYDEAWFRTVLTECQLLEDVKRLPNGADTLVGSDGMNLSVGQRQRVSVARGAYSQADVMVMDDIFGSQDQNTAKLMLQRLLGPEGLLRRAGTTVLFATHLSMALDVADEVLLFDGESHVTHMTEFDPVALRMQLIETTALERPNKSENSTEETDVAEKKAPTVDKTDDAIRTRGEFGLYRFYFGAFGKFDLFLWLLVMGFVSFCDGFLNGYLRIWTGNDPHNNLYLIGFALLAFSRVSVGVWNQYLFYMRILPNSGERIHELLLAAVMTASYAFLCTVDSGSLLNRFSQDMSLIVQTLPIALYRFMFMFYSALIEVGFIFAGATYSSIALPFLVAAVYFIQKYYLRTSRQLRHLDLEAKTPLFVCFRETANGLPHIRAFGWSQQQFERSLALLDDSQKPYYHMFCAQRLLTLALAVTVAVVGLVVLGIALYVKNSSSPAAVGLSYMVIMQFANTVTITVKRWTEMEVSLGSIARSRSFVEDTPLEKDPEGCVAPENWPRAGHVEFKNVTASYGADPVLRDVSFEIQPRTKVAINGRSGSGKSSLLVTLLNFLDYTGTITIDGVDIQTVPRQTLRASVTTITQVPVALRGSIRHNLAPFLDEAACTVSEEMVEATLQQLGLWEPITALAGGLDAQLADAGFSAAQLQLLCVARAVLHHEQTGSRIVLMDEATASLSSAAAADVQRAVRESFAACTVLSIAHWESSLQRPDAVLEVAGGRVSWGEQSGGASALASASA